MTLALCNLALLAYSTQSDSSRFLGIGLLIPPGGTIAYSWAINGIAALVCVGIILYEWRSRQIPAIAPDVAAAGS